MVLDVPILKHFRVFNDNYRYSLIIVHQNISCDPTSEPSGRDGSEEESQQIVY